MSRLMLELFRDSPLLVWPLVSLTIFVAVFVTVVVRAARLQKTQVSALSDLPLTRDDEGGA